MNNFNCLYFLFWFHVTVFILKQKNVYINPRCVIFAVSIPVADNSVRFIRVDLLTYFRKWIKYVLLSFCNIKTKKLK